ncbi:hypothetical protein RR42_s2884 [Cupriavidus basilensis]|uniref:Uncharacterized protein n=1 Tax=Cupriavidus basilensis TaxID=68895 RepID=A0A0C4YPQ3_9BURK|nr:hypothetical protein RR42_s2884 [Cupriavidus basilensis]
MAEFAAGDGMRKKTSGEWVREVMFLMIRRQWLVALSKA